MGFLHNIPCLLNLQIAPLWDVLFKVAFMTCCLNLILLSPLSDCFCGTAKVQCKFSAHVPDYQGNDLCDVCLNSCYSDSAPPHDDAGYHSVHSCIHANWLGFTSGQ